MKHIKLWALASTRCTFGSTLACAFFTWTLRLERDGWISKEISKLSESVTKTSNQALASQFTLWYPKTTRTCCACQASTIFPRFYPAVSSLSCQIFANNFRRLCSLPIEGVRRWKVLTLSWNSSTDTKFWHFDLCLSLWFQSNANSAEWLLSALGQVQLQLIQCATSLSSDLYLIWSI